MTKKYLMNLVIEEQKIVGVEYANKERRVIFPFKTFLKEGAPLIDEFFEVANYLARYLENLTSESNSKLNIDKVAVLQIFEIADFLGGGEFSLFFKVCPVRRV